MPTIFSNSPYFDDYDETKKFYRILFKPGRPVQARELNQLQTLLQAQIERFGNSIVKEGTVVIPGEQVFSTKFSFVRLQSTFAGVEANTIIRDLIGTILVGQTSGVRALVEVSTPSNVFDPPTLFVTYKNSGTSGLNKTFLDGEVLTNINQTLSVITQSSNSTGFGSSFSVGEGIVFTKGNFVYVDSQTFILDKYGNTPSAIVGYRVVESVVDSNQDESLLDPAIGTFNYFAPGADRYSISLELEPRNFVSTTLDDPNFIEIARIQDGEVIGSVTPEQTRLRALEEIMARRTFDESGNYIVKPYNIQLTEHLRKSNSSIASSAVDGLLPNTAGGNSNFFVSVISAGKAYVRGFELDSRKTKYVLGTKARDFVQVNDTPISTQFGDYVFVSNVFGSPPLSTIGEIELFDRYTDSFGNSNGEKVGSARLRHLEFHSGTVGTPSAVYKAYLFNVTTNETKSFVNNVKQLYVDNATLPDFTADIVPTTRFLTGSVSTTNSSNALVGAATAFTRELKPNDYILINNDRFRIVDISSNSTANIFPDASVTLTNQLFSVEKAVLNDTDINTYFFQLPYDVIKTVDPTNTETNYSVKRSYDRTLSSGNVTITAASDETFAPITTTNYAIILTSGSKTGNVIEATANIIRGGSPVGKTITVALNDDGFTNETIQLITTVQKTNTAAAKKIKTLVSNSTITLSTISETSQQIISLGKADGFRLNSVLMSLDGFSQPFNASNTLDITNRYIFNSGQKPTFYDLAFITLGRGQALPIGPIRINFDYFTHSSGDYFSVTSYPDLQFEQIPKFNFNNQVIELRNVLDFRPRIDDNGNTFTGSNFTEMIDQENDLITDFEYYLPRTDKIVLNDKGDFVVLEGVSSLTPIEPKTPENAMDLFIFRQKPYVFDLQRDVEVIKIPNTRYTMKDISRIETRVKTLEYYTALNLLELETQALGIKDEFGFDRFKNGFIVDNFEGHGIGDVFNEDYAAAIDYNKREGRPLCNSQTLRLVEKNQTNDQRISNNYVVNNNEIVTLPYKNRLLITNTKASRGLSLNPFNIPFFGGKAFIQPPADIWIDQNKLPDVLNIDENGNYDNVLTDARAKGLVEEDNVYGTVWGNWRDFYFGNEESIVYARRDGIRYQINEDIKTTTKEDVVINDVVIPKMRSAVLNFSASGLKPSTVVYAFFNDFPVSQYCSLISTDENLNIDNALSTIANNFQQLKTNSTGDINLSFFYNSDIFDFDVGSYVFRIIDSFRNDLAEATTMAEQLFTSQGREVTTQTQIISTRNAILSRESVVSDVEAVLELPKFALEEDLNKLNRTVDYFIRDTNDKFEVVTTRLDTLDGNVAELGLSIIATNERLDGAIEDIENLDERVTALERRRYATPEYVDGLIAGVNARIDGIQLTPGPPGAPGAPGAPAGTIVVPVAPPTRTISPNAVIAGWKYEQIPNVGVDIPQSTRVSPLTKVSFNWNIQDSLLTVNTLSFGNFDIGTADRERITGATISPGSTGLLLNSIQRNGKITLDIPLNQKLPIVAELILNDPVNNVSVTRRYELLISVEPAVELPSVTPVFTGLNMVDGVSKYGLGVLPAYFTKRYFVDNIASATVTPNPLANFNPNTGAITVFTLQNKIIFPSSFNAKAEELYNTVLQQLKDTWNKRLGFSGGFNYDNYNSVFSNGEYIPNPSKPTDVTVFFRGLDEFSFVEGLVGRYQDLFYSGAITDFSFTPDEFGPHRCAALAITQAVILAPQISTSVPWQRDALSMRTRGYS